MFALITHVEGNDVYLHDLAQPVRTSDRRCKLENVTCRGGRSCLISRGTQYVLKQ